MPRATRQPIDERARARLRDAQKVEANAVAEVHAAAVKKQSEQAKLDAVIAKHQGVIDDAHHVLSEAQAHLVSVSGIHRAALLLEEPIAALRAAVRAAKGDAREEPT